MGKRLSEAAVARCREASRGVLRYEEGAMTVVKWWRTGLLALIACLVVAGCSGTAYQPAPADQTGSLPGDRGGDSGGGSGSSM